MDFIKARYIMMGPIFSTMASAYYYLVLYAITNLFGVFNPLIVLTIVTALFIISLFSFTMEHFKTTSFTRFLLTISETLKWLFLVYGIFTLFIYIFFNYLLNFFNYLLNFFINFSINIPNNILYTLYLFIYCVIIPILAIYAYYNAHHLIVKEHNLYIKNLTEELSLIHISDLHIGSIRNKKLLTNLTKKINSIACDLVIISGDLADGSCPIDEDMFIPLKELNKPIFFTYGNHDYYMGIDALDIATSKAGIYCLNNENTVFKGLNIYGLSFSLGSSNDMSEIEKIARNIDKNQANLLIYHIPSNWDFFKSIGFDIQLSGHTHGGQFYPMNFFVKSQFPYLRGLFRDKNSYLSVSDGVGTLSPPMRLGTHSEIVLLNLKKK
ncbi:MAG: metallophosphoesterase [Methanobrevibacter sp.]|jgi:predicted MPP superfamily phosphohydrolase|nr:metallophosphoesterase [Candidatus Methanoflexus mossambicus]